MTRLPIYGSAQPVEPILNEKGQESPATRGQGDSSAENLPLNGAAGLEAHDLEAALQLLVERAQYITGATGAALALAQGGDVQPITGKPGAIEVPEMVCRASAGTCAPPIGARLQVQSGLTGESVARKQLLRCDNAENDPRVNLETCQQLGIASIVVLPLLSGKGEVRGLFELFSDHAYAFEERDLVALERMADLTRTALDLAEKTTLVIPSRSPNPASATQVKETDVLKQEVTSIPAPEAPTPAMAEATLPPVSSDGASAAGAEKLSAPATPPPQAEFPASPAAFLPQPMKRIQKCASCGFPVSEGRTLCVDCEEKSHREPKGVEAVPAEFVPSFGISSSEAPAEESWLANHVNILAILVLILSIAVAVVVFR